MKSDPKLKLVFVLITLWISIPKIGFSEVDKEKINQINQLLDSGAAKGNLGDFQFALRNCSTALSLSRANTLVHEEAVSLHLISSIYLLLNDFPKAIASGQEALKISLAMNDSKEIFKNYMNLGDVFFEQGNDRKALHYYTESLKRIDGFENPIAKGRLYNSLGNLSTKLNNFDQAIRYFKTSVVYFQNANEWIALSSTLSHIGIGFSKKNQMDSALVYYLKALKIKEDIHDEKGLPSIYNNIGTIYGQKSETKLALRYFEMALEKVIPFQLKNSEATFYNNIADMHLKLHNTRLAEWNLQKAMEIGNIIHSNAIRANAFQGLSLLALQKGDYQNAYQYQVRHTALKDSVFNLETTRDLNEKIVLYETEMKDKEIELLNVEKRSQEASNQQIQSDQKLILVLVISGSLFFIFGLIFFYYRRQRLAQKAFLVQLIHSQEEERKRISKELHDGIGQSLLVLKNNMTEGKPLIESTIEELRTISRNLHPILLEKLGFKKAIENVVDLASKSTSIYMSYEIDDVNKVLNPEQQINIFRIVQECMSNILKHSQATAARVVISKLGHKVKITIFDNGIGFNLSEAKKKKSLGLASMAERTKLISGDIQISSIPGQTKIEIKVKCG